jgi:hypothetical protein
MTEFEEAKPPDDPSSEVSELPKQTLPTYARLWQLETWLRRMVYVELRALRGDGWSTGLPSVDKSFQSDKRLTHMPTPEMNALSYAQLSALKALIADNWTCFQEYLPPQNIWDAKLEEIAQIRHRVAHFRRGHADDYRRLVQFLRDIDAGFWKFCTSYNDPQPVLPASDNEVVSHFLPYDPFPWTEVSEKKWARIGFADPSLVVAITIEVLHRPWAKWSTTVDGQPGYLYDVHLHARGERVFEYPEFLASTRAIHPQLVHLCLDALTRSVRFTIPAVLGGKQVTAIVERCHEVAGYVVRGGGRRDPDDQAVQRLADEWPEFVLGPDNPLTFLGPGMPCSFFGA